MKTYSGRRDRDGKTHVWVVNDGVTAPLDPRFDLANKSPTGFEWGYGGSGPAQLAIAIIADATGDDAKALRCCQAFKFRVLASLDRERSWSLTRETVLLILAAIERDTAAHGRRRTPQPGFGRRAERPDNT